MQSSIHGTTHYVLCITMSDNSIMYWVFGQTVDISSAYFAISAQYYSTTLTNGTRPEGSKILRGYVETQKCQLQDSNPGLSVCLYSFPFSFVAGIYPAVARPSSLIGELWSRALYQLS